MEQKSIVLFFQRKGWNAKQIHMELTAVLGEEAVSYASVTRYLRSTSFEHSTDPMENSEPFSDKYLTRDAIISFREDEPFASLRRIAKGIRIPKSTVYYNLVYAMGWKLKHLKWVPHRLSDTQKQSRVEKASELLTLLRSVFHQGMDYVITLDESWFYLSTDYEQIWLPYGKNPPERERKLISSTKIMIAIVWRASGILLIKMLPKGRKFKCQYMIDDILKPLCERLNVSRDPSSRKFVIHFDNAKPHNGKIVQEYFKANRLRRAPHPAFPPDVAPTNFFLLGYVKDQLQGRTFEDGESLLDAVEEIVTSIPQETLQKVYQEWLRRLEAVIASDGDYI
jgi:histone-lysine N-methyltransferase SETMAR